MPKKKKRTNYDRIFGDPERAAETIRRMVKCCGELECSGKWCPIYDICSYNLSRHEALAYLKKESK